MGKAKYHFAYDEVNGFVDIATVSEEDRECHKYHCISCGAEMIAKLGKKNIHHFAHKGGDDSCNKETYLHKLGKYLLKKKFEENGEFPIKYERTSKCSAYRTCRFCKEYKCTHHLDTPIDLKRYFDTCTEEQTIGDFRADLLLSDSTGRHKNKILLEIRVSHECTEEKKLSGNRIIEMRIKSEEDLFALLDAPIEENESYKFFGFKREINNTTARYTRRMPRFVMLSNGKVYVNFYSVCLETLQDKKASLELIIDDSQLFELTSGLADDEIRQMNGTGINAYVIGLVYAINSGCKLKNCSLCKYSGSSFYQDFYCCMSRKYGTPYIPDRQSDAAKCKYYSPYHRIALINKIIPKIPIVKIESL